MADKINKSAKLDKSKALTFYEALNFLKEERGLNIDNFLEYQSKVRKAESNGDYTAIQVPRKGYTSAPGRGAYQYEMDTDGGSGSAITALNRAKAYAKRNGLTLPDDIINSDGDFSKMSPGSQDMVDLFNLREAPSGDINAINKGDYGNVYVNHHYAGPKDERPKKLEYFNSVTANMKKAEASTEASTEGIPLDGVGPIGIVEAQDFRAIATMALGGRPLLKSNQTIEMSKNKKNVLKVAKGNYPELPKYAGGGSPVSSPNPQPYTFNPQSVNPGSVATLQSRAQPIDTSGAVQIMQNSDNLAVKNRQLDFEISQEKARVSKLEGKERDRAESALMASYSPNIDEMIQNYGLDPKFKRDQELIAFLRQEEKNFKDQQYVVVGKNKGNERAVDSGLAQLQLDFMAKINSNEDIKKQREINAQYAAVDERVKKSQKGTFSQARLYTDLYEKVNDYKNGVTDEIPEGTFDLNRFADNSTTTEASMLAATNAFLGQGVSGRAETKDGYQYWSTYYDDSLLTEEKVTEYTSGLTSLIKKDIDFRRKYNIKDGEESTFAEKYYKTIRGENENEFRTNKDKLTKISKDDVDSDGFTAEARAQAEKAKAKAAAKKSRVSNFNLGSTEDEDGNATAGLDIRVEEKRENGTLTGLYDIKYGKNGKQLTDAEIRNGKLFLPYDDSESRDFLVSGGFLQKGYTTIYNNEVNELGESDLGKKLTELPGFEENGEGVLIPLTAIEGGDSPTEDSTGTSTGTTTSTELTDTDMENVVFGENENYTKDAGYKHAIEVDKIPFSGSLDDPMKSFNGLKPYAKRAVGLLSPFMNEKGIVFTSGTRGEGYAGTKGSNGEGTHQNGEKVDMQFVVEGSHFKNNPAKYKEQLEKQESFLRDFETYVKESGGSVTRTEKEFDDFTYNYTFMKGGKEVTWRGRVHKSFTKGGKKSGTSHIDWDFSIGNNTDPKASGKAAKTAAAGQTPTKSKSGSKSSWGRGVGGL